MGERSQAKESQMEENLRMKILLILLVAFASSLLISTSYAEKKGSEENPLNFSVEEGHQDMKQEDRFLHKKIDMGRKIEGGIKGPYVIRPKNLVEKTGNLQVTKNTAEEDDDDDDDGVPSPPRDSSSDSHRRYPYPYDAIGNRSNDVPKPSP
ncbi:hypothetical protein CKAN_00796800 [Cinnamomum micranthum f. kanehirae]|uniref:Uncharacterized protein n=1 Tax=Cinnamomum micranthum f. kanehirae TaxID=337451 RepID=A0A443NLM2_9MAGN|nr:hypothetical protein CKAN_00796800 [Cinnamomum micranthum f. kanehirae]